MKGQFTVLLKFARMSAPVILSGIKYLFTYDLKASLIQLNQICVPPLIPTPSLYEWWDYGMQFHRFKHCQMETEICPTYLLECISEKFSGLKDTKYWKEPND